MGSLGQVGLLGPPPSRGIDRARVMGGATDSVALIFADVLTSDDPYPGREREALDGHSELRMVRAVPRAPGVNEPVAMRTLSVGAV